MQPDRQATLFCRVSSAKQADNFSRDAQERLGRDYATRLGLTITKVFHVVETASKQDLRREWQKYLEYVRRGPEKHALIATVDRALRNYSDLPDVEELQKEYGKTVHFFLEGLTLDGAHVPASKLRLGIQAAVAVYYAGELAEKTKRGIDQKAIKGEWPFKAPYGYLHDLRTKRLAVDADRARWVRRIKELSAQAQHSIDRIREIVTDEGCRLYDQPLTRRMIERVIRNPLYTGRYDWPQGSGQWIQGTHEPLVAWDLHEAAVAGLERKHRARYRKHLYTFAGVLRCGCCPEGRAVVFEAKKGGRYLYAHCTGTRYSKAAGRELERLCPDAEFVPVEAIERQVLEVMQSVMISYDLADELYADIAKDAGAANGHAQTRAALLRGQLKQLEERSARAYADKLDGKIDEEFWATQAKRWGDEKVRLQEELRRLEETTPPDALARARQVLELAKNIVPIYNSATVDEKRRILNLTCSNWRLVGKKLDYTIEKPFAELREGLLTGSWRPFRDAIRTWALDGSAGATWR